MTFPGVRSTFAAIVVWMSWGGASAQPLSSLPPSPPSQQTIVYVGKTTTTNFDAPGLGEHLQYFPAFDLPERELGLRTDGDGTIEITPDFENFEHHVPLDFMGRTFSPDALGDPIGVKTAGDPSWAEFTLPGGRQGRSGVVYDPFTCGTSNNSVNQLRINSANLHDFCLNLITDNTNGEFDPDVDLQARSDDTKVVLQDHPDFSFDGQTDMYTFRYMGMQEGDRIRIRMEAEDGEGCQGGGLAGIMVSDIATCTPPPGTCTPSCGDRACGDDGCGGSCGICPRADKLHDRTGHVTVTIAEGAINFSHADPDVEGVVAVGDSLSGLLEDLEESLRDQIEPSFVEKFDANHLNLNVRNFKLTLKRKVNIDLRAQAGGTFRLRVEFDQLFIKLKLVPESEAEQDLGFHDAILKIRVPEFAVEADYDPIGGTVGNVSGDVDDPEIEVDVDSILTDIQDALGLDFIGIEALLDLVLELVVGDEFRSSFEEKLGELGEDLDELMLPAFALVPPRIEIGGIDYAEQIRQAILHPAVGERSTITFDASNPHKLSGDDPVVVTEEASATAIVGNRFRIEASLRSTDFPPITGRIERAYRATDGDFAVDGWTCAERLGESLDVGVFADGYAVTVDSADGEVNPTTEGAILDVCEAPGSFLRFRYSLASSSEDLGCVNAWDNRMTVIAGLDGFEKTLGPVPAAGAAFWLPSTHPNSGATFNDGAPERHFVGDFNGDGKDDYLWEWYGWWVALANEDGDGFEAPALWLPNLRPGAGGDAYTFPDHPERHFVADFNRDGKDDYMWERDGWWVALSNGNGFANPTQWLASRHDDGERPTYNPDLPWVHFVGDFNGDGRADYLWARYGWWVALANESGDGFETPTQWLPPQRPGGPVGSYTLNPDYPERHFVADFDEDGKDDYLWEWGGWWVALSNGSGFATPTRWLAAAVPNVVDRTFNTELRSLHFVGDFNGDGKADYLWEWYGWWVALANEDGDGFETPTRWMANRHANDLYTFPDGDHPELQFVGDFDGDGKDDYLWQDHGWWIARSNGTGFEDPVLWLSQWTAPHGQTFNEDRPERHHFGDFTGDGLPDYLWQRAEGWRVASTLLPRLAAAGDSDCDGVPDAEDGCPVDWDPGQDDVDADGTGDACDTDCADGVDNDADGHADFPSDPGCRSADGYTEKPACNDGVDNDGDGRVDGADPGCAAAYLEREDYVWDDPCHDGLDNDGDGQVDLNGGLNGEPPDLHCATGVGLEEPLCGLGFEIAPLIVGLAAIRRRRRRRSA